MTLNAGLQVGPYEIVSPLGSGGMGEVYRAVDTRLSREVALKILSTELASSGEHLRRFEQEARAASALNHPNIITIYDVGTFDAMGYIAMELVEGKDLRSLVAGGRLPMKQMLRIVVKVADGLAAAHDRGIVHRDLKPENIMVTRDGFVKLLDFGLAKLIRPVVDTDSTLPHTIPGAVFGTVGYMSPEQASGREVDFRSDQFALGVILYELLAGRLPFVGNSAPEILAAIIRETPPSLRLYSEAVPDELMRIVDRLLSKDREDRYASTRDLARDLREVRDRFTNSSDPRHRTEPRLLPVRRRTMISVGVALLVVLFGAGLVTMLRERVRTEMPARPPVAMAAPRSIAVMPFRDQTGLPAGQMLTDGISATIMNRLVQTASIRVAAPFYGAELSHSLDAKELAQRTRADLVVEGAVQSAGDQLRIVVAIVNPRDETLAASSSITGASGDLFDLQDQVAERVVQMLRIRPKPAPAGTTRASLTSPAEQRKYLEAYGLLWRAKDNEAIDQAIARLNELLRDSRDSAHVNSLLGRAFLMRYRLRKNSADLEQAALFAERAAELDSNLVEVHTTLGDLRSSTGKHDEAAQEYTRALELNPDSPLALSGMASTLEARGRLSDAEAYYQKLLQKAPDWPNAYTRYARFLFQAGRFEEALTQFRRVTELMPDSARAYGNLGGCYQALGKYEEAVAAHQRSLALQPSSLAHANLGTCYFAMQRYADAAKAYEAAAKLDPEHPVLWLNLGDARRWTSGEESGAKEAYAQAIAKAGKLAAVNPKDESALRIMASAMGKSGRLDEAQAMIRRALKLDPTDAQSLYHAAVIALLRGDEGGAMGWLGRAVDSGYPRSEVAHDPELKSLRDDPQFRSMLPRSAKS